jgi:hypothetical protein
MADEGREDTTQQAPPVDQPTEDSPALDFDPGPQVVDSTAVEEPVEQHREPPPPPPPPGPEPSFEPTGGAAGPSPHEADRAAAGAADPGRPEIAVIGAFAGAFLFAQILKRIGGGGDG